jgi:cell wall-associated NlpC family hydrolase
MTRSRATIQEIKDSLQNLQKTTSNSTDPSSTNFSKDLAIVRGSVNRILSKPTSARTSGEQTAIEALGMWVKEYDLYATTARLEPQVGLTGLDPNDSNGSDNKCNFFVAIAAARAGVKLPITGRWNKTPLSAETLYNNPPTDYLTSVSPKDAKIGDIISFSGHIGIYLGNGLYVSARNSENRPGSQTGNGLQITRVPWDGAKIYRASGKAIALNGGDNNSQVADNLSNENIKSPNSDNGTEVNINQQRADAIKQALSKENITPDSPKYNEMAAQIAVATLGKDTAINVVNCIDGVDKVTATNLVNAAAKQLQPQIG